MAGYNINNYPRDNINVNDYIEIYYTGGSQTFVAPNKGSYKLECWGGQGGERGQGSNYGGTGGYSVGTVNLERGDILYAFVGGGLNKNFNGSKPHPWNQSIFSGGATDFRYINSNWDNYQSLLSRIIVAGGGGWYGGGGVTPDGSGDDDKGGGGGSGYVLTGGSHRPVDYNPPSKYFMYDTGTTYEANKAGDGYAKITVMSAEPNVAPSQINVLNTWVNTSNLYAQVNSEFKPINEGYVNIDGIWKKII